MVLCLIFSLMPNTFFDFEGLNDAQYGEALIEALQVDRASFSADAFRSLAFITLSSVAIWLYLNKTLKENASYSSCWNTYSWRYVGSKQTIFK